MPETQSVAIPYHAWTLGSCERERRLERPQQRSAAAEARALGIR
jgi:hypothetical protein